MQIDANCAKQTDQPIDRESINQNIGRLTGLPCKQENFQFSTRFCWALDFSLLADITSIPACSLLYLDKIRLVRTSVGFQFSSSLIEFNLHSVIKNFLFFEPF